MFKAGKEVRAPHQQQWSEEKLELMLRQLKEIQQQTGQAIGWCHILPQNVPVENGLANTPPSLGNQQPGQAYITYHLFARNPSTQFEHASVTVGSIQRSSQPEFQNGVPLICFVFRQSWKNGMPL